MNSSLKIEMSVIMPAWNRAYCIGKTIQSVLAQGSDKSFEIIVLDAGSQDGTAEAAAALNDPRIRVKKYPVNKGINFSRNRAIEMAIGEWLVFLDSDDQLVPEAFDVIRQDIALLKDKYPLICYGTCDMRTRRPKSFFDREQGEISYKEWIEGKKMRGEFLTVVQRKVFKEEMFREDMYSFEGYFWLKLVQKYNKVWVHNINLRLYESKGENRATKQLMKPEYAASKVYAYQVFLKTFGEDMKKINPQLYIRYLYGLSHFCFLNGDKKKGREVLKEIIKYHSGVKIYGIYLCSFLGQWPFRLVNRIARWWC